MIEQIKTSGNLIIIGGQQYPSTGKGKKGFAGMWGMSLDTCIISHVYLSIAVKLEACNIGYTSKTIHKTQQYSIIETYSLPEQL